MTKLFLVLCILSFGTGLHAQPLDIEEGFRVSEVAFTGCSSASELIAELKVELKSLSEEAMEITAGEEARPLLEEIFSRYHWWAKASEYSRLCLCDQNWSLLSTLQESQLHEAGCHP